MAEETTIIEIEFGNSVKNIQELNREIDRLKREQKTLKDQGRENSQTFIQNASDIRVLTGEVKNNTRVIDNVNKSYQAATGSMEQQKAELAILLNRYDKLSKAEQQNADIGGVLATQIKSINDELKGLESAYGNNKRSVGGYKDGIESAVVSIESLKLKLKDLQQTIQTTEIDSDEFRAASDEAGKLGLQIGQLEGKLNEFGNRVPKNPAKKAFDDAVISAVTLGSTVKILSDTFVESEDSQKALAKAVQGFAIAQTVANIVKEKGAILDTATLVVTKAQTAAQVVAATVTRLLSSATAQFGITATAAWAAASLGISLLIAGIIALVANFKAVSNAVSDFLGLTTELERSQREASVQLIKNAETQQKAAENAKQSSDIRINQLDREIALLQAQGKTTIELEKRKQREIIITANTQRLANAAEIKALQSIKDKTDEQIERLKELGKENTDLVKTILDADNQIDVIESKSAKDTADKQTKSNDEAVQRRKEYNDKIAALSEKFLLSERDKLAKSFDDELKLITGNGEKAIQLRAAISQAKSDALEKFDNDIASKEADRISKNALFLLKLEEDSLENRLKIFEEGFKAQEAALKVQGVSQVDIERAKNKEITEITESFNQERLLKQVELNNALLQNELDTVDNSVASEREKAKLKAEINLKYLQDQLKIAEQLANIDGVLTDQELANIEKIRNAIIAAQNATIQAQTDNPPLTLGELFGATPEGAAEIDAAIQQGVEALATAISVINERYQRQIDGINSVRDAEIAAVDQSTLSEEQKTRQKEQINRNAAKRAYALQVKQFNAEKALNITTAIINAAQAALKAAAQLGPAGAIIGAAIGATQIGLIASQKPPAPQGFATGVVGLDGPGTQTSDSIPAWLSKGESVITASGTDWFQSQYPGLLEFANSNHKFATGVVDFNPEPSVSGEFSLIDAIRAMPNPVVKVSDIDKGFNDVRSVQVTGQIG